MEGATVWWIIITIVVLVIIFGLIYSSSLTAQAWGFLILGLLLLFFGIYDLSIAFQKFNRSNAVSTFTA